MANRQTAPHNFLAEDDLTDCIGNIAHWLGTVSSINAGVVVGTGVSVLTSDTTGHTPLEIDGFSTAQTGAPLVIKQVTAGNTLFRVSTVSTATNGVVVTAAATGNSPTITTIGTDTNVGLTITPQLAASVVITGGAAAGAGPALTVSGVSNGVNGVVITNAATGTAATLSAGGTGSDANIGLIIAPQGSAAAKVVIQGGGTTPGAAATFVGVDTAVNGLQVTNAATGGTVAVAAIGTDAQIPLSLAAKGTTSPVLVNPALAIPAGGSLGAALTLGATAAFGLYIGSGAPSVSAAKGSLYLRSDGSSTSTRLYSASDSAGTWVAVTTAS